MSVTGNARVAGVIGWPVSHSRSPRLHNYWIARYGIDGAYVPLAIKPQDIESVLRALPKLGFAGANVTVPHKEAAHRLADRLEPSAARTGAVNTLVVQDGTLIGSNTDGYGFIQNLRASAPGWSAATGPAVIVGAGGAARAIAAALIDERAPEIRIVNRTRARADALVAALGRPLAAVDWGGRADALKGAALLVNATTQGMTGAGELDLPLDTLPRDAVVNDIVYVPLTTRLLAAAAARGNPVVDGLGMLLHQAAPGFAAWFGRTPDVDAALRDYVIKGL
jgi:shikimate dehydrogenase